MEADKILDLSGEVCPVTAIKTRAEFNKLREGETLKVVFTSKKSAESVAAEFRKNLVKAYVDGNKYVLILKR
ncbi:SirA family protein [Ferroglobus placidus DSM 10642]|uniref:SirA family protein n=1 Tax=Ferroglobus placidus (strain DSM 10642 / AEDII12DO) TaxID=589924 RepID=D3S0V0_FERPA|nr:sulfurtransferase TusA family protein [Ferroglobus placidus]ADC66341.1 SirA family protein [Ferroglobus placidus DSM 10642]